MTNNEKGSTSVMVLLKSRMNYKFDDSTFEPETIGKWTPATDAAFMAVFDQKAAAPQK